MANVLANVVPKLLAQGLLALRQQAIMPRLVNTRYETMAGERGSTIEIPIPSAVAVTDVVPAATAPAGTDINPTKAIIALSQWKEAAFTLTDKEQLEIMEGVIPMQASEAVKSLANTVDAYIMAQYFSVFNMSGTPGTTPFAANLTAFHDSRKLLNNEAAPMSDRRVVLDASAEANALAQNIFLQADQRGDQGGVINGQIGRKIGADWFLDQNVVTHTKGSFPGAPLVNGAHAVGASTIAMDGFTASQAGVLKKGDLITFAGGAQTYTVLADVNSDGTGVATGGVSIYPSLRVAVADNAAVAQKASHVVNMQFHRDAFAFASRPLQSVVPDGLGVISQSAVDPVSGIALRLEVTRQFKQLRWSFDILYGAACVRPELACRIAG